MSPSLLALMLLLVQAPASIEGFVVRLGNSRPVVRARVDLIRAGVGVATTRTDLGGKFTFVNVAPGSYRVSARQDGYLYAEYGAQTTGPTGPTGATLTVASRQELKDIVIHLPPAAAISGKVYDRFGEPVVYANVQASRIAYQDGRRTLISGYSARTNDLGEYRLFWMLPGRYVVSASPQEGPCTGDCGLVIQNGTSGSPAVIGGAIRLNATTIVRPSPNYEETFLPAYFPGTTDPSAATPIDLQPGADFRADLTTSEIQSVHIRGQVVDSVTGQAAGNTSVALEPRRGTVVTDNRQRVSAPVNGGFFDFRHVAPGSYDLIALSNTGGRRLSGHAPVDVRNANLDNVAVVLRPEFNINGRVLFDGDASGVRVELRRDPYLPQLLVPVANVAASGTFTLTGVTPGDYQIRVTVPGGKTYLRAARYGAQDALSGPFQVTGNTLGELEIALSPNAGELDVAVASAATVVLVPDPPRRERLDLYYVDRADREGRVHLDSIAPGSYKVFAWTDVIDDAWVDPEFLRPYESLGVPVRIDGGASVSVRIGGQ